MRLAKRCAVFVLGLVVLAAPVFGAEGESLYDKQSKHHFVPQAGFVPDEETAIKIAMAVWTPIYHFKYKPEDSQLYHAKLIGDVWHVNHPLPKATPTEVTMGGGPEAEIAKADGKILRVSFEQ